MEDCVVADAVVVEPVSTPIFPANREYYREISQILGFATPETASTSGSTAVWTPIPYSVKQGIIPAEQGMLMQEQGILLATRRTGASIVPLELFILNSRCCNRRICFAA